MSNVCNRVQLVDQQELISRTVIQRRLINPDIAQIFEGSNSFSLKSKAIIPTQKELDPSPERIDTIFSPMGKRACAPVI